MLMLAIAYAISRMRAARRRWAGAESGPGLFPTTAWSTLLRAKSDPEAMKRLIARYVPPVVNYFSSLGFESTKAETMAQEVFATVSKEEFLLRAERSRGRFRSLVLAVANAVAQRQRTGVETAVDFAAEMRDEAFDRLWVQNLVRQSIEQMRASASEKERPLVDSVVKHLLHKVGMDEIARELGLGIQEVQAEVQRVRFELRKSFETLIQQYCSSKEEFDAELGYLGQYTQ